MSRESVLEWCVMWLPLALQPLEPSPKLGPRKLPPLLLWPLPPGALPLECWMRDMTRLEGSTAMLLL